MATQFQTDVLNRLKTVPTVISGVINNPSEVPGNPDYVYALSNYYYYNTSKNRITHRFYNGRWQKVPHYDVTTNLQNGDVLRENDLYLYFNSLFIITEEHVYNNSFDTTKAVEISGSDSQVYKHAQPNIATAKTVDNTSLANFPDGQLWIIKVDGDWKVYTLDRNSSETESLPQIIALTVGRLKQVGGGINPSDIVNDFATDPSDVSKVAGANAVYALYQLVASDDVSYDTIQEIVNFIKTIDTDGELVAAIDTATGSAAWREETDISGKQDTTDNNLNTTDKTVVGAINEIEEKKINKTATALNVVNISDGTQIYPSGHPNAGQNIANGILFLDVEDLAQKDFIVETDNDFTVEFYRFCCGSFISLSVFRKTAGTINITFPPNTHDKDIRISPTSPLQLDGVQNTAQTNYNRKLHELSMRRVDDISIGTELVIVTPSSTYSFEVQ